VKRLFVGLTGAIALVLSATGTAAADPPTFNGHNCAGAIVSELAGPGFGEAVAGAAHEQVVDNFGFANCGQPPRQNP
jgi:hypothetical protein